METQSFAIVMDDLDSPFGFVHWLVYNMPGEARVIGEGASSLGKLPSIAAEGVGTENTKRYIGPCHRGHHYAIRIYALEMGTSLPPGLTKQQLRAAVKGHILAEGQLIGIDGGNGP